jgi:hypothetical protein
LARGDSEIARWRWEGWRRGAGCGRWCHSTPRPNFARWSGAEVDVRGMRRLPHSAHIPCCATARVTAPSMFGSVPGQGRVRDGFVSRRTRILAVGSCSR